MAETPALTELTAVKEQLQQVVSRLDSLEDSGYKLCFSLKDLSEDMVKKVVASLEGDPISLAWFCHSFGLDREETPQYPRDLRELFRLFSGTPVQLLKDVCEALQLHDVVELLEKAKPPTLRPALPMKEIEKLTHSTKRPTTFYSKVTALTIDDGTSRTVSVSKRMGLIFEALNSRNKVITITAGPLDNLCGELRELKWKARRESKQQWVKKKLQKIEKEIDQKRDKLQKEKEKFQRALATVIDQWVHKEDKATLFAVFDLCDRDVEIAECLTKELALIAGDAKLVITPSCEGYKRIREIPETLHVEVKNSSDTKAFVDTMLEVLSKRWQTMDLISVMQEVQRSHVRRSMNCTWYHWSVPCKINDSLSSLPRLQKPEKTLNNGHE